PVPIGEAWLLSPLLLATALFEQGFGGAQIATGLRKRALRLPEALAFEQQRELDAALRLPQRGAHMLAAVTGQLREDRFAAPRQLAVRGLHIDHQPLIDPAEP